MTRRAVFLDRDGVLNRAVRRDGRVYPPLTPEEMELLPGVGSALARLRAAGFLLIVATNQPDVARGRQRREVIDAMHASLREQLVLDEVRACYHDDGDGCECRKPQPGMLREAAGAWGIDLASSYMVGDRWRDIEAGRRAGCTTLLVEGAPEEVEGCRPDHRVTDLGAAAELILKGRAGPTAGFRR
jgi:D-glycero-D-manno-heptose 1,7-bisphosphate phosphatase